MDRLVRRGAGQQDRRTVMGKTDPIKLAQQFMGLNADDFRMFWTIVGLGIDDEDGDE